MDAIDELKAHFPMPQGLCRGFASILRFSQECSKKFVMSQK
jgi:hypothetical protein